MMEGPMIRALILRSSKEFSYLFLLLVVPELFFFVGIPPASLQKDAGSYDAYATNIISGNGYSIDGTTFSTLREPGYPFFLAAAYEFFGAHNVLAVFILQTILLGLAAYLLYRVFLSLGEEYLGYAAGLSTVILPSYGLYAHTIGTELLFMFFLSAIFYLCVYIFSTKGDVSWQWYALLGLLMGYATLVRVQLIFFFPFLVLCFIVFVRPCAWKALQKVALASVLFMVVIGSWMLFVHQQTGKYTITSGRPEVVLYMRAVRAQLSYTQLTTYAYDWLRRSITGGVGTPFLMDNEFKKLGEDYNHLATTTAAVTTIKKQNIATLIENPGHYIYGNLIEAIKLAWIEHDYSNFLNRYVRAGMYLVVYGLFLFGIVQLLYKKRERGITAVSMLALLFIAYNYLILTTFDTIPRYNTPYLFLYMLIGFAGIALWNRRKKETPTSTPGSMS